MKTYLTNCTQGNEDDIVFMVEQADEIDYQDLIDETGIDNVKYIFPDYGWDDGSLKLKDDYAVSFWKSFYLGEPCVYIVHSSIEYIFC